MLRNGAGLRYTLAVPDPVVLTEAEAAELIGWSAANLRLRRYQLEEDPGSDVCPPSMRLARRVVYREHRLKQWIKRHPEISNVKQRLRSTISQDEVCAQLGISRTTLRERRRRLRAKKSSDAAPPHVMAGQEVRYKVAAVRSWVVRNRDLVQSWKLRA